MVMMGLINLWSKIKAGNNHRLWFVGSGIHVIGLIITCL